MLGKEWQPPLWTLKGEYSKLCSYDLVIPLSTHSNTHTHTHTYTHMHTRMHMHMHTPTHSSCVRVVSSTRSGMGKSLFITRLADKLNTGSTHVTIPIHGPEVTPDTLMEFLKDHMEDATSTIFHFDIAPTVNMC